jgi:uncharacterized protein
VSYKMTTRILILCVALQVLQMLMPGIEQGQVFVPSLLFSLSTLPQFITGLILHMFSHAGWGHLAGNMFLGIPCMLYLEPKIGSRSLLANFMLLGAVAALAQSLMPFGGSGMIGSSGAVFGLYGMVCGMFPNRKYGILMMLLALLPQLAALNLGPLGGSVANGAHLGGLVLGLMLAKSPLKASRRP